MMERIEIALASDQGYFCGLIVTACSIAKSCKSADDVLSFTILDGGIKDADFALLEAKVRGYHAKSEFRRISVNDETFKDCPIWNGNRMTYARLMLPYLLKDVDYCIYCDVDFLWMRDIAELWRERRPDIALISTMDGNLDTLKVDGDWLKAHNLPFDPASYFCAGLTFFNLKMFREAGMAARCFELLKLTPPFNDQTVMYVATYGKQKLVEKRKWQVFTYELTQSILDAGCVVHHAGEIPWKVYTSPLSIFSDAKMLWLRFYAEIYGISTWAAVRRFHPAGSFIYHRALYWFLRTPGIRQLIRFALIAAHKPGAWKMFEARSRGLKI